MCLPDVNISVGPCSNVLILDFVSEKWMQWKTTQSQWTNSDKPTQPKPKKCKFFKYLREIFQWIHNNKKNTRCIRRSWCTVIPNAKTELNKRRKRKKTQQTHNNNNNDDSGLLCASLHLTWIINFHFALLSFQLCVWMRTSVRKSSRAKNTLNEKQIKTKAQYTHSMQSPPARPKCIIK